MGLFDIATQREWQCPPADADTDRKLGWLRESIQQGMGWVQSQRGSQDWRRSLEILSGIPENDTLLEYRAQLSGCRLKTNTRTFIAGLANIRPLWGFHAGKLYSKTAEALNRVTWSLYLENYWDMAVKDWLAYATATNTGWARPVYRRNLQGKGNIDILTYGLPCVAPVQVPNDGDFQKAYSFTLLDEIPIYEAHWRFKRYQDRLKPTMSKYWYASEIRRSAERNQKWRVSDWFGGKSDRENGLRDMYIPIAWTTINDCAINETGEWIPMGEPGTSWYYEVPSYGMEIPDGYDDDGKPQLRKADENDARLYPQRRLMISSEQTNTIMYDGPGFNWDGELDMIPMWVDKWPWEPTGLSPLKPGYELQRGIDEIDIGNLAKIRAQMDPALAYSINAVDKQEAEDFDPMRPRDRIGYDSDQVDAPFKNAVPMETYRIYPEAMTVRQNMVEELDYLLQNRDIVEMAKARALGKGMDQLEALAAANGPIVKDIGRGMENSLGQLGRQVGSRIIQYLDTARIMQYTTPEGLHLGTFDFDPNSIVPSHMPGEQAFEADRTPRKSMYSRQQRSKWFEKSLSFT